MPKPKPLSKTLLAILANLKESAIDLESLFSAIQQGYGSAFGRGGRAYVAELKKFQNKRMLQNTVRQLQRSKYLSAKIIGQRLIISLTILVLS